MLGTVGGGWGRLRAKASSADMRAGCPLPPQEELLLWRDPKRSGLVFGAITVAFGILQFAKINAIQTTAYLVAAAVLGCFVWNNVAKIAHK